MYHALFYNWHDETNSFQKQCLQFISVHNYGMYDTYNNYEQIWTECTVFYDWHDEIESFQKQIHLGQKWFRYPYCALHACSLLRIVLLRTKNLDVLGTLYHGGSVVYVSYCLWFMVRMTEFWWLVAWQDSSCGNWKLIFCLFCFSVSCASEVYIIILYIIYICLLMLSL